MVVYAVRRAGATHPDHLNALFALFAAKSDSGISASYYQGTPHGTSAGLNRRWWTWPMLKSCTDVSSTWAAVPRNAGQCSRTAARRSSVRLMV
jgi:LmbE family N-acetylglucosaminyl deacetylase